MKILKFYSNSCTPCKMMTPLLNKLNLEFGIEVEQVNVTNSDLLTKYNIKSVPTLILLDNSENEIKRLVGSSTYDKLKEFINVESN